MHPRYPTGGETHLGYSTLVRYPQLGDGAAGTGHSSEQEGDWHIAVTGAAGTLAVRGHRLRAGGISACQVGEAARADGDDAPGSPGSARSSCSAASAGVHRDGPKHSVGRSRPTARSPPAATAEAATSNTLTKG